MLLSDQGTIPAGNAEGTGTAAVATVAGESQAETPMPNIGKNVVYDVQTSCHRARGEVEDVESVASQTSASKGEESSEAEPRGE